MSGPVERVVAALRAAGCDPRRTGKGWAARCPAHDDRKPSLSIGVGDDGCALVTCHAGCSLQSVLGALGLTERDLFERRDAPAAQEASRRRTPARAWPTVEAAIADLFRTKGAPSSTGTYRNVEGEPVGVVLRWDRAEDQKDVLPLSRSGDGWTLQAMQPPRPLYNLCALAAGRRVYVCEGEKAADAAIACGLLATTSAGGSRAASRTDWSPLAGKDVVIVPDNDDAGDAYAADVAELTIEAGAKTVRIARLAEAWPDIPAGGDFADIVGEDGPWSGLDDDDVRTRIEALAAKAELIRPDGVQRHQPFPVDALPEPVRSYVAAGAEAIGCDASFVALPMLSALAGAIGNTRCVRLKRGWTEPAILWTAIVGESGTQKTPAFRLAVQAVRSRQHRLMKEHTEAMKQWEAEDARYEAALAAWKRKAAKGAAAPEPPEAPKKPVRLRAWIEDCTTEALAALLQENPRGLLTLRNELSGWFSFGQYKNGGGADDVAHWLQMFDGDALVVDRKTSGTIYVPRAAVSIAGGIQPAILARSLGRKHRDNGLLARLLLAYPPRRAKRWTESEIDPRLEDDVAALFDRLYAFEPDIDAGGDPTPHIVPLTVQAKLTWIDFVNEHGERQVELVGDEAAAWSKLEGYAARLALVVHLVRAAAEDPTLESPDHIDEQSVAAGVHLSRWFAAEALRVYALLDEEEEVRERRRLVERIELHGGEVAVRDWQRLRSHRTVAEAEAELAGLVEAGLGRWRTTPRGPKGGRPSRRFVLAGWPHGSDTTSPPVGQSGPAGDTAGVSSVLSVSDVGASTTDPAGEDAA